MNANLNGIKAKANEEIVSVETGFLLLTVDLKTGTYGVRWHDGSALNGIVSAAKLDNVIRQTTDYTRHHPDEGTLLDVTDGLGRGIAVTIVHTDAERHTMKQQFTVYEDKPFIAVRIELAAEGDVPLETGYMAPVLVQVADGGSFGLGLPDEHELRALLVPFDNDKWVRYESVAMPGVMESYEATAVYDPITRKGLVMGSITHDTWKTGLKISGASPTAIDRLEVYGGATGELTRDSIPHGIVKGLTVQSPVVFIGSYMDFRDGMEAFGRANAAIAPALPWKYAVPFGWNSWSAAADKLDYDLYVQTSDFLRGIRDEGFHNNGVVYINFDSFWTNLSEEQLESAVKHVWNNGQKAGIYWTPFAFWGNDYGREVEGTDGRYKYEDLLLRDRNGNILPSLDGGIAIDPTHPGNLLRTDFHMKRFVDWGFEYVKLDFLGHGALEGRHYESNIHTGIQAYNFGMDYLTRLLDPDRIGRPFHINLSIAPLFPHQYGHSRRISCDAFGLLSDTEYMLNSLTYGWWMNDSLYRFNDPDHTVLYQSYNQEATSEHEGRTRLNASVISGTVLLMGDDFRKEEARRRASEWLSNTDITDLAQRGQTFVPVQGTSGSEASDVFMLRTTEQGLDCFYIAVFNFDKGASVEKRVLLERLGVRRELSVYRMKDLWTGAITTGKGDIPVLLEPAESKLLKVTFDGPHT
jgi:alpha-galactosidase